jgi:hypothetical protein
VRPLEQRAETASFIIVALRNCRLHLSLQGQEALMKRDLFRSRLVTMSESIRHITQPTPGHWVKYFASM